MNNILNKLKEINYPTAIIISALIFSGAYFSIQYIEQRSADNFKQLEINRKNKDALDLYFKEQDNKKALDSCISEADLAYWSYIRLNGEYQHDSESYTASQYTWKYADDKKQTSIDNCYKRYK